MRIKIQECSLCIQDHEHNALQSQSLIILYYFAQCAIIIVARGITEKILSESGTILQGHNLSRERAENCEKVSKLLEMTVESWSAKLNEARACRERRARNRKWPYNATSYPILFLASGFVHRNRGRECNWTRGEMLLALHRNVFRFCFVLLKDRQRMRRRLSLSLSLFANYRIAPSSTRNLSFTWKSW